MVGYTEIGTSYPKPDCIERNALHQGAYSVYTPALLHTGVHIM